MAAKVIDGKAVAAEVRARVAKDVEWLSGDLGRPPGWRRCWSETTPLRRSTCAASARPARRSGSPPTTTPAGDVSQEDLVALIAELNANEEVDGILCQLPLPDHLDADAIVNALDPGKDVDGLTPISAGRLARNEPGLVPCTPLGVMELLSSAGVDPSGREAVIVGRSNLVGKPSTACCWAPTRP